MNTKVLALVSTAVLLCMSGAANAGGKTAPIEWLLARFGIISETPVAQLGRMTEYGYSRRPFDSNLDPQGILNRNPLYEGILNRNLDVQEILNRDRDLLTGGTNPVIIDHMTIAPRILWRLDTGPRGKVLSLYDEATPQILNDLNKAEDLTQQKVKDIINEELTKAIDNAPKEKKSGITFEVLTGKLKVERSYGTVNKITAGEVNVYKVSAALATGVMTCKELNQPLSIECVKTVLAEVGKIVTKEMKIESADSATKAHVVPEDSDKAYLGAPARSLSATGS